MECQAVQAQLSAWLDDELSEAAGAMLTAHLERCEACRSEWRQLDGPGRRPRQPGGAGAHGAGGESGGYQVRRPRRRQGWQSVALAACLVLGIALGGTVARSFYGAGDAQRGRGGSGQPGGLP